MTIEEAVKACENDTEVYSVYNLSISKVKIKSLYYRHGEWIASLYCSADTDNIPICGLYLEQKDAIIRLAFLLREKANNILADIKVNSK